MKLARTFTFPRAVVLAVLALGFSTIGCGPEDTAIHLTGSVTHNGQPVPKGVITFSPDTEKGNSGHGAVAIIRDGKYTTRESLGVVGGPHVVRIEGFDGVAVGDNLDGKPLFPAYETKLDLPTESTEFDMTVPPRK